MDRRLQPAAYTDALRTLGRLYAAQRNYPQALKALNDALEIAGEQVPRSDEQISGTLQAIADTHRQAGDLEKAAEFYQKVTVYANYARRASDDLRETLSELERRRETLQAAQQSLALLSRGHSPSVKDLAYIHALIAHAHEQLNQPQERDESIRTLLSLLAEHHDTLHTDDANADMRALGWLAASYQARENEDLDTAQFACGSALEAVRNANLRWVIEQYARSLE
jgi:tetratricopeptide (TPR) repeat protein